MKRLNPKSESFNGPKSYFTDFDHRIVVRTDDLDLLRIQAERKLKLLLLIKSKIVCAASHLATEFAYDIFKDNPQLLLEGHIVPALRRDKSDFSALLERKKIHRKEEIIDFFNQNVKFTADWELEENSGWFREQFIQEITDPTSIVRKQLAATSLSTLKPNFIENMKREIGESQVISRSQIQHFAKELSLVQQNLLLNFRELLYHLSGARVVHCESSLPQENYIDYDIADLNQKRTKLSEEQILFKLFIEMVFETIQRKMIPYELLDYLSFSDVLSIRKPIMESDFQNKYDYIVNKVICGAKEENGRLWFDINELEKIRSFLEITFSQVLEEELPAFLKKRAKEQTKSFANIASSVALGILGFIPGLGGFASGTSILKDSPALIFNVRQTIFSKKSLTDLSIYQSNKESLLRHKIENSDISDRSTMLDMVDLLSNTLSEKLKL